MRTLALLIVSLIAFEHCDAFPQLDSVFVTISDDTVKVWNTGVQANCASQFAFSIVLNSSNAFTITEVDTVGPKANCICTFELAVALPGIGVEGTYYVYVFRAYRKQFGYPSDTTLFIGSTQFIIGPRGSATVSHPFYQSACLDIVDVGDVNAPVPVIFRLYDSFPNPFNPSTTIKYELPMASMVRLSVYDIIGREVSVLLNERREAGVHEVKFEAAGLAGGVYFYRLQAGNFVVTKQLLLLK